MLSSKVVFEEVATQALYLESTGRTTRKIEKEEAPTLSQP